MEAIVNASEASVGQLQDRVKMLEAQLMQQDVKTVAELNGTQTVREAALTSALFAAQRRATEAERNHP